MRKQLSNPSMNQATNQLDLFMPVPSRCHYLATVSVNLTWLMTKQLSKTEKSIYMYPFNIQCPKSLLHKIWAHFGVATGRGPKRTFNVCSKEHATNNVITRTIIKEKSHDKSESFVTLSPLRTITSIANEQWLIKWARTATPRQSSSAWRKIVRRYL